MSIEPAMIRNVVEAALLAAGEPVSIDRLLTLFEEDEGVGRAELRTALETLGEDYEGRGLELREVASGWRVQVRTDLAPWVSRLWESRPPRYSRALLETLALIAYQQPITRSDIEQVRGVSVSSNIIKTLLDRDWIRIVGHRDVPGRPALYGTTRAFLDYFDLRSLDQLPPLAEIRDLAKLNEELGFDDAGETDDEAPSESVPLTAVLGEFERSESDEAAAAEAAGEAPEAVETDDEEALAEEDGDLEEPEADEDDESDPGAGAGADAGGDAGDDADETPDDDDDDDEDEDEDEDEDDDRDQERPSA